MSPAADTTQNANANGGNGGAGIKGVPSLVPSCAICILCMLHCLHSVPLCHVHFFRPCLECSMHPTSDFLMLHHGDRSVRLMFVRGRVIALTGVFCGAERRLCVRLW